MSFFLHNNDLFYSSFLCKRRYSMERIVTRGFEDNKERDICVASQAPYWSRSQCEENSQIAVSSEALLLSIKS